MDQNTKEAIIKLLIRGDNLSIIALQHAKGNVADVFKVLQELPKNVQEARKLAITARENNNPKARLDKLDEKRKKGVVKRTSPKKISDKGHLEDAVDIEAKLRLAATKRALNERNQKMLEAEKRASIEHDSKSSVFKPIELKPPFKSKYSRHTFRP